MEDQVTGKSASTAHVTTDHGSRYLQQLCKHFGHKVEATFDPHAGEVKFPFGVCRLEADETGLTMTVQGSSGEEIKRLQDVVDSHLVRFAFREELNIDWLAV